MWTETYAPKNAAQILGPSYPVEAAFRWIKNWRAQEKRCLLISGPVGCGKTMLARMLCAEFDVVELDPWKPRTKKQLLEMEEAFGTNPLRSYLGGATQRRQMCVLADEVDSCDQGGLAALVAMMKAGRTPAICTCGDGYNKKLAGLERVSLRVRMCRPTADQISQRLCWIAAREHFESKMPPTRAKALANACCCDVRQCVSELQHLALTLKTQEAGAPMVLGTTPSGGLCDQAPPGVFDAVARLFPPQRTTAPSPEEAEVLHSSDRSMISALVAENYLGIKRMTMETAALVAESMSLGDATERKLPGEMQSVFFAARPAMLARGMGGAGQCRFPSQFAQHSRAEAENAEVRRVARQYGRGADPLEVMPGIYACLAGPAVTHPAARVWAAVAAKLGFLGLGDTAAWDAVCRMGKVNGAPSAAEQKCLAGVRALLSSREGGTKKGREEEGGEETPPRAKKRARKERDGDVSD
jgi:DNA polymerase III delta prime subunit